MLARGFAVVIALALGACAGNTQHVASRQPHKVAARTEGSPQLYPRYTRVTPEQLKRMTYPDPIAEKLQGSLPRAR